MLAYRRTKSSEHRAFCGERECYDRRVSALNTVALVAGPLVGAVIGGVIEMARERQRARSDATLADQQAHRETRRWRDEQRSADRVRQADRAREWVREQIAPSIDIYTLTSVSSFDAVHAANAAAAVDTLIASRGDLDSMSITRVIVGFSSQEVIAALRALTNYVHFDIQQRLQTIADLTNATRPDDEISQAYSALTDAWTTLDAMIASTMRLLEDYCYGTD